MATVAKLIPILVSSLLIISCGGNKGKGVSIENVAVTGDSSVNRFVLRDTSSFVHLQELPDMIDDPYIGEFIGFSNASSTEYLLMVRENGGLRNQYNYFYLTDSIASEYKQKMSVLGDSIFYTTSGVHIGSSETEFCDKYKGMNFTVFQSERGKIYEFQDTINMYQSKYRFIDGRLKDVEFGYVW